jgi:hypothetical protein
MIKCNSIIKKTDIQWTEGRTYSDTFIFKSDPLRALRVSYYNQKLLEEVFEKQTNEKSALDAIETDPIRVEKKMAQITNALVEKGFQPHYVQQLENTDCMNVLTHIAPAIPPVRRAILLDAKDKDLQQRYNNVQVFLRHSGNMTKFMFDNKPDSFLIKILLFQVLYGLGILQTYIQGFKHGNLTTSAVLIEKKKRKILSPVEYEVPGTSRVYFLPDLGLRARITDFDYASGTRVRIEGLETLALKNFRAGQQSKDNDVVYFLKSFRTEGCPQASAFVKRALKSGNKNVWDVLQDAYFDDLRI